MRIIIPKVEILQQSPGIEGILQQIKLAGQTCYDSESKRTAKEFTDMLIKSNHGAMLEHGTVYLYTENLNIATKYIENPYSYVHLVVSNNEEHRYYITTNYRVIIEKGWEEDLQFITDPKKYHEKRVTVRFTTQIAVSREYNRHRVNSIAEQSTRYCNYSKDKYDNQISIVKPTWVSEDLDCYFGPDAHNTALSLRYLCNDIYLGNDNDEWDDIRYWLFSNLAAEYAYLNLLKLGRSPQEARAVLPLDTRTELVHTAYLDDWKHFFDLRALGTTGKPHPDAKILADPLMEQFKQLKLI